MEKNKQIELMRARNAELNKELEELKDKLKIINKVDKNGTLSPADVLISDIEKIKAEYEEGLKQIKKYQEQYATLIAELKALKKFMNNMGFKPKPPLYRRFLNKVKRK